MEEKNNIFKLKDMKKKNTRKNSDACHTRARSLENRISCGVCLTNAGSKASCGWYITHSDDWKGV